MSESSARLRIVLDTNVYVSGAISAIGAPRRLLLAWSDQRFHLLLSGQQYNELTEVFGRPQLKRWFSYSEDEIATMLFDLGAVPKVDPSPTIPVRVRDPKDVKILAAAIGGDADYLVTGDADLLVHRDDSRLGKLRIVAATEFLAILDQRAPH